MIIFVIYTHFFYLYSLIKFLQISLLVVFMILIFKQNVILNLFHFITDFNLFIYFIRWFLISENMDNRFVLMNHLVNVFIILEIIIRRRLFFVASLIVRQILFFFDIRKQFIITCFDVCLLVPQKQFKWLNFEILWTCKNFTISIFLIRICVIRLFFIFINLMCYFIFDFFKFSAWIDVEYVNWFW